MTDTRGDRRIGKVFDWMTRCGIDIELQLRRWPGFRDIFGNETMCICKATVAVMSRAESLLRGGVLRGQTASFCNVERVSLFCVPFQVIFMSLSFVGEGFKTVQRSCGDKVEARGKLGRINRCYCRIQVSDRIYSRQGNARCLCSKVLNLQFSPPSAASCSATVLIS